MSITFFSVAGWELLFVIMPVMSMLSDYSDYTTPIYMNSFRGALTVHMSIGEIQQV